MLSNSCKYGIRALIYIASKSKENRKTGLKEIAKDLELPTPFLAKILQQLAKKKLLSSTKGPHGGFSISRDPSKISLLEIVNIIDGDELFTNCLIHSDTCKGIDQNKEACPVHDYYTEVRTVLYDLFSKTTLRDLALKTTETPSIVI